LKNPRKSPGSKKEVAFRETLNRGKKVKGSNSTKTQNEGERGGTGKRTNPAGPQRRDNNRALKNDSESMRKQRGGPKKSPKKAKFTRKGEATSKGTTPREFNG